MFRVLTLACVVVALVCSEEAVVGPGESEKPDCIVNLGVQIRSQSSKTFPLKDITKFAVRKDKRQPESSKFLVHLIDAHSTSFLNISIPLQLQDEQWSNISLYLEGAALQMSGSSGNVSWDVGVTSVEGLTTVTGFRIETLPGSYLKLNECFEVSESPSHGSTLEDRDILLYTSAAFNCLLILVIGCILAYLVLDRRLALPSDFYSGDQDSACAETDTVAASHS